MSENGNLYFYTNVSTLYIVFLFSDQNGKVTWNGHTV